MFIRLRTGMNRGKMQETTQSSTLAERTERAPIRVALVEDKPEELEAFIALLRTSRDIVYLGSCGTVGEALELLPPSRPHVILMDINLSDESGVDCMRELRPLLPDTQFMMLTVVMDHEKIFDSLSAGATGYLLKGTRPEQLLEAVRELHQGGSPMSGQIAREVIRFFHTKPLARGADHLTASEKQVLEQLARGLLYKEVADKLQMSSGTVRTHIWHIYKKLQVHNRTEAISRGLPR